MKVLRIISSMAPKTGGPCQGIRNSIPRLQELGVENEVVCLDDPESDYGVVDDFQIYKLGNGKTGYQYHSRLVEWLVQNLGNYSHVLVHGLWQFPNYAVYKAIKKLKDKGKDVPNVAIMPHGMLDPYFQRATERRFKALRNEFVWRITEKKAINNADALFFTCEEELRLAKTTFKGYQPKKEINVGYGIQKPPQYSREFSDALYKKLPNLTNDYWLFLSRIHPKKGVDLLISAYKDLAKTRASLPALVIAGPLESDYAIEMIKLAGNHPNIHFPGMLVKEEKWEAFYNCEAFVLPSHQENFGIAVVEAMACRKPVLISDQVNIWREIQQGGAGLVFNDTVKGTHTALENFLELTSEARIAMGELAHNAYITHFSIEKAAQRMRDQLHLVLQKPK
ncbi:glycosyl transferase family 1 [Christiangramia fulva]|uniref:Glycosyl transferase family 1 n=1 Tax=Christiangramia fulva TaxID=2126553 RepID=A0A2R3ZAU9_9FLAO|nr:glycosyltransferase [Christiangramia fulva]AVR47387.1 glycosyl transferase family 1 [Christiangramia fulva]